MVKCRALSCDPAAKKLSLSLKIPTEDESRAIKPRIPAKDDGFEEIEVGQLVSGVVVALEDENGKEGISVRLNEVKDFLVFIPITRKSIDVFKPANHCW